MNKILYFNDDKYEIIKTNIIDLEINDRYTSKSTVIFIDCKVLYKRRIDKSKDDTTYLLVVNEQLTEFDELKILENILKIELLKNKQEYSIDFDKLEDEIMDCVGDLFRIHTTPIMIGYFSTKYYEDMRNRIYLETSNYLTTQFANISVINSVYNLMIEKYNLKD